MIVAGIVDALGLAVKRFDIDRVYVVDTALYSGDNLQQLGTLRWICRAPLTLTQAHELIEHIDENTFQPSQWEGYRMAEVCCVYGGVKQRLLVVESSRRA